MPPDWPRIHISRARASGEQYRHDLANAASSLSDMLEGFARMSPEAAEVSAVLHEALVFFFNEGGLRRESAMGNTDTDGYGILRDIELGKPVSYSLAWSREVPRLRSRVHLTRDVALATEAAVDQHRSKGRALVAADLIDVLDADTYERVLAETDGIEQRERLDLLARALDVQSVDRVEVLHWLTQRLAPQAG